MACAVFPARSETARIVVDLTRSVFTGSVQQQAARSRRKSRNTHRGMVFSTLASASARLWEPLQPQIAAACWFIIKFSGSGLWYLTASRVSPEPLVRVNATVSAIAGFKLVRPGAVTRLLLLVSVVTLTLSHSCHGDVGHALDQQPEQPASASGSGPPAAAARRSSFHWHSSVLPGWQAASISASRSASPHSLVPITYLPNLCARARTFQVKASSSTAES
eukprot:976716-Rhodomonas_salina.2